MQPGGILAGRYLIGKVIGYGGFGVTYIGWDNTLQQRVAIKEYLPSEFATRSVGQTQVTVFGGNKAEQFTDGMVKFVEEAKRLAQFQNEPGIVRVFDSFEANNTAYIVMEYLDGETLTAYLEREGKLPVDKAIEMLTPVIQSLEAVHKTGVIHRDIAPDNIMLTKDGQVKLIDFGAARYATTSRSRSLTVIIKPGYSPEEQYRSRGDQGSHTDVYALASVLYRMVTGITPPDALERRAFFENKKKDILVPLSKNCKIEKNKEHAILNAMNVRIEDRTKTAGAFLNELTSTTPVKRLVGKIKAIDLMKWPLWAKIVVPVGGVTVIALFALLLTGRISFTNNLVIDYTLGEGMTRVPSVINYSVGVAQDKLDAQELTSIISGRETSDTIPANMVLRQGIDAGGVVQKGTSVELYVSAAAEPTVEAGTMPDVAFYTEDEAKAMLVQLDAVVTVEREYSSDVAEGVVIRASVGYGETLVEGDEVTLYVSNGPDPATIIEPGSEDEPEDPTTTPTEAAVTLNRSSLSLFVGDAVSLSASGGNGSFSWNSSNSSVATVRNGSVTAVGRGSATITVSSNGKSASCSVTVQDYTVELDRSHISLHIGESSVISVSGVPSGALTRWSSSDDDVVIVNDGEVTAVAPGSAEIIVHIEHQGRSYTALADVSVSPPPIGISTFKISNKSEYAISVDEVINIGCTIGIRSGTYIDDYDFEIVWTSSNRGVATVESSSKRNANVIGVGVGSATITAKLIHGGYVYFTAECNVTVEEEEAFVDIFDVGWIVPVGTSDYVRADASTTDVSGWRWSSDNTNVATVRRGPVGNGVCDGFISAVSEGVATITVSVEIDGITYSDSMTVEVIRE